MKIAILGTGMVGRTLAERLAGLGHDVQIGTRSPQETMARTSPDPNMGTPGFATWHKDHANVKLVRFEEAARHGELVMNATAGRATIEILSGIGHKEHLSVGTKRLAHEAEPVRQPVLPLVDEDGVDRIGRIEHQADLGQFLDEARQAPGPRARGQRHGRKGIGRRRNGEVPVRRGTPAPSITSISYGCPRE